ncbi:TPA: hypothetical protein ACU207_002357 [Mannheimia haemolytica]|uniref:hypothetical protein n=1 Tax=Mannheimia haemolytica TaxID=75985 RepID=UPI000DA2C783|nr:hypothetical protein [Mannheimia haemolytica]MCB4228180.1 hypothetical protein [Mannheimia haemolytica]MEE3731282.1 hypothetical protein [Mannheimia haemolytica]SQE31354.1 Uncharacterised protein [Mannheimia haemolytica]
MAIVKIRFSIEVDGELLIDHKIEQEKNNSFDKEREFAEEVINKLNTFYTGMNKGRQSCLFSVIRRRNLRCGR